jgi:hypothetical protein
MKRPEPRGRWYHGSQQELRVLRAGSSITQRPAVARAFSHRPATVAQKNDETVKHDGRTEGFLYVVDEEVQEQDIYPHPHPVNEDGWEWLTRRPLAVRLIERTVPRVEDLLTETDIQALRRMQAEEGTDTFARPEDPR